MMKYVVCGNSVEDVANGVEAMKRAIASGATCGVGGSSVAEVEQALGEMVGYSEMLANVAEVRERLDAIHYDCLHPSCDCPCPYCDCECEDEDDYEEGYMVMNRDGEAIIYDLYNTAEGAMSHAIAEGWLLDEIAIDYVRVYDDGEIKTLESVYPN